MQKMSICLSFGILCTGLAVTFAGDQTTCGDPGNIPCGPGEFCQLPDRCQPDTQGICIPAPTSCDDEYFPICGCDGNDYPNQCSAHLAGVQVDFFGFCDGHACDTAFGLLCPAGEFCWHQQGECNIDHPGTCRPFVTECPEEARCSLVCGCDGFTYRTECDADLAKVTVSRRGACNEVRRLRFLSAELLVWDAEPGANGYNVYLNDDAFTTTSGPVCHAAGLENNLWTIPSAPQLGELWEIELTAQFTNGEGPMGVGSLCASRRAQQQCGD